MGSSTSGFFCVITPISLSPGITSSRRFLLFCRPTFSGITVPGNTTMFRIGKIGRLLGTAICCPLLPPPVRMTVAVGVRSMICDWDIIGIRSQRSHFFGNSIHKSPSIYRAEMRSRWMFTGNSTSRAKAP